MGTRLMPCASAMNTTLVTCYVLTHPPLIHPALPPGKGTLDEAVRQTVRRGDVATSQISFVAAGRA